MRGTESVSLWGVLSPVPAALVAGSVEAAGSAGAPAADLDQVAIVQAVPDATVDVTIDGRSVQDQVATGKVLGPYALSVGEHRLDFSGSGGIDVASTVEVAAGSNQDVVLHLPASVGGDPVVNSYRTPTEPIGPGKARVLVAHTATVAPADVHVDGQVVFEDIANGEFATADVPAGHHVVALLPTAETGTPILGPLDVELTPGTVTSVYAIGNPEDSSMTLIAHTATLAADGSLTPVGIDTGSVGLADGILVRPFGPRPHVLTGG